MNDAITGAQIISLRDVAGFYGQPAASDPERAGLIAAKLIAVSRRTKDTAAGPVDNGDGPLCLTRRGIAALGAAGFDERGEPL